MNLPNNQEAYIPPEKLTNYLLSESHAVGKSKAKFFLLLGFEVTKSRTLEEGLLAIAQTEPVIEMETSSHGTKYIIEGIMNTPSGLSTRTRTVWIIETNQVKPRFVTAYPA
ncbi:MAG: hypothetical protein KDI79_17690 [Anaerolineae bacterium]|nr:hypothetical protein [Anaerolineae bacterium]